MFEISDAMCNSQSMDEYAGSKNFFKECLLM